MERHTMREGDTLNALSARYRAPACAILRANRVFSPAWLSPGREILIPDARFCQRDGFPCPVQAARQRARQPRPCAVHIVHGQESAAAVARAYGLPERLVYLAAGRADGPQNGQELLLPLPAASARLHIARPGETLRQVARANDTDEETIRRENCLWGPLLPGMKILV